MSDSVPSVAIGPQFYQSQPPLSMAKVIMSRHVSTSRDLRLLFGTDLIASHSHSVGQFACHGACRAHSAPHPHHDSSSLLSNSMPTHALLNDSARRMTFARPARSLFMAAAKTNLQYPFVSPYPSCAK